MARSVGPSWTSMCRLVHPGPGRQETGKMGLARQAPRCCALPRLSPKSRGIECSEEVKADHGACRQFLDEHAPAKAKNTRAPNRRARTETRPASPDPADSRSRNDDHRK